KRRRRESWVRVKTKRIRSAHPGDNELAGLWGPDATSSKCHLVALSRNAANPISMGLTLPVTRVKIGSGERPADERHLPAAGCTPDCSSRKGVPADSATLPTRPLGHCLSPAIDPYPSIIDR